MKISKRNMRVLSYEQQSSDSKRFQGIPLIRYTLLYELKIFVFLELLAEKEKRNNRS